MKNLTLALLALLTATSAQAADFGDENFSFEGSNVTQVVCHDTRNYRDEGLRVSIQTGGFVGLTTAVVSHMTLAGPIQLTTTPVTRNEDSENHPGLIAFNGETFRLVINMSDADGANIPARLKARMKDQVVSENLICQLSQ